MRENHYAFVVYQLKSSYVSKSTTSIMSLTVLFDVSHGGLTGANIQQFLELLLILLLRQLMLTVEADDAAHLFAIGHHDARIEDRVALVI